MGETNYERRRCLSVNWEFRKRNKNEIKMK